MNLDFVLDKYIHDLFWLEPKLKEAQRAPKTVWDDTAKEWKMSKSDRKKVEYLRKRGKEIRDAITTFKQTSPSKYWERWNAIVQR